MTDIDHIVSVHGLNSNPDKMLDLVKNLHLTHLPQTNINLSGHNMEHTFKVRSENMKTVNSCLWENAFSNTLDLLADKKILVIAFSLGGLLACLYLLKRKNHHSPIKKMVLFAPALRVKRWTTNVKFLKKYPRLPIPSFTPKANRSLHAIPIAAYNALFELIEKFDSQLEPEKLNIPTLLIIDENDELVDYNKTVAFVQEYKLDNWNLIKFKNSFLNNLFKKHLIYEYNFRTEEEWRLIKAETQLLLKK